MKRLNSLYQELPKLQKYITKNQRKLLILIEGLDASGKSSTINRLLRCLDPAQSRVVRLSKPTTQERSQWYFQRYVPHLPAAGEIVFFDRSWYNRAGLERVMGFASKEEVTDFYRDVLLFEELLARSGIQICKFYLSITKEKQQERIQRREEDNTRPFRVTPLDREAVAHYDEYDAAAKEMFQKTSSEKAAWVVINEDKKRKSRRALLSSLLSQIDYQGGATC